MLKRGITGDAALWAWMKQSTQGKAEPVDVTITLLDEQRQPVMAWKVKGALPSRLAGPTLNANASGIAIEVLELSHNGIELDD